MKEFTIIKYIIICAAIFFILLLAIRLADADEFTFEWDYGEQQIDGFRIYSGILAEQNDGTWYPQIGTEPIIDAIAPDLRSATGVENGIPGQSRKYCFVARAFRSNEESPDSNFICKEINNLPLLQPNSVTGSYDRNDETVTLAWIQPDAQRAKYWKIYYKIYTDDYIDFARVDNTGQDELTVKVKFAAAPENVKTEVKFAIVAFKNENVFSPDSEEIIVVIDREPRDELKPPEGFRFKAIIQME